MNKYDVHVILKDKFHSVVLECDGFRMGSGGYIFYRYLHKGKSQADSVTEEFAWYPIANTVIEEYKEIKPPTGSGKFV